MLGILRAAEGYLRERDVDAPRLSVEWLMAEVLGISRLQVYLSHDRPVSPPERSRLRELVARRGQHEPLAYILGEWEFFGHRLEVTADVLVPRPETEHLVELCAELAPQGGRVADLGTGSGAIAVAVALQRPDLQVVASDVSAAALAVAGRNAVLHELPANRLLLVEGSACAPLLPHGPFDVLVSNPPYVDPARKDLYDAERLAFEPRLALFTEDGDPTCVYRDILADIGRVMAPGGWLLMETGVGADQATRQALEDCAALTDVELRYDYAGLPRYLLARVR